MSDCFPQQRKTDMSPIRTNVRLKLLHLVVSALCLTACSAAAKSSFATLAFTPPQYAFRDLGVLQNQIQPPIGSTRPTLGTYGTGTWLLGTSIASPDRIAGQGDLYVPGPTSPSLVTRSFFWRGRLKEDSGILPGSASSFLNSGALGIDSKANTAGFSQVLISSRSLPVDHAYYLPCG